MDRIQKFIYKLSKRQQAKVRAAYCAIIQNDLKGLDIKPLKGRKDWFRCRIGNIRIIFFRTKHRDNIIHSVQFRGKAYRDM